MSFAGIHFNVCPLGLAAGGGTGRTGQLGLSDERLEVKSGGEGVRYMSEWAGGRRTGESAVLQ